MKPKILHCGDGALVTGGLFFTRKMTYAAGEAVGIHAHSHPHEMTVWEGEAEVSLEGFETVTLKRGEMIDVPAMLRHSVKALTDQCEIWCKFAHRNEQGEIIDYPAGYEKAYT